MSKIIFLNGCGSSGKTTIAKNIQNISTTAWLHFSLDNFIDMLPKNYIEFGKNSKQGYYRFIEENTDEQNSIKIERGPLGARFFDALPKIAKLLADEGNDLIIDEVILKDINLKSYINALKNNIVYFVGVFCDIKIFQEREINRGNRELGLSNNQYDLVHSMSKIYDLKVDTSKQNAVNISKEILNFISQNQNPQSLKKMYNIFYGTNNI